MQPEQCVIRVGERATQPGDGRDLCLGALVNEAARFGFGRILLLGDVAPERLRALSPSGDRVVDLRALANRGPPGIGGALPQALPHLDETVLLLDGETWFDFNWLDLVRHGEANDGWDAIIALREAEDLDRRGAVELRGERVLRVGEGRRGAAGLVCAGVSLWRRAGLMRFAQGAASDRDILPAAAAAGRVIGLRQVGLFLDVGTPEGLRSAGRDVPARLRRPAAFLDRDGVLNVDHGYTHRVEDLDFVTGAERAVRRLNEAGYYVFVVTNQAGVARGLFEEAAIGVFHAEMQRRLRQTGAHVDDWRHCPYHPDGTVPHYAAPHPWRKPRPGMILDLIEHWPIALEHSFLLGDKSSDVEAAEAAGLRGIFFAGGDLDRIVADVLAQTGGRRDPPR